MSRWGFLLPVFVLPCLLSAGLRAQETPLQTEGTPAIVPTPAPTAAPATAIEPVSGERILSAEEREKLTARAKALTAEAEQRRAAAEKAHEVAKIECWKKFLVSSCLDDARTAYRKEMSQIMLVERDARAIERDVRRHSSADRTVKRDVRNAEREIEMEAKAEKHRAKQAEEAAKRDKKVE